MFVGPIHFVQGGPLHNMHADSRHPADWFPHMRTNPSPPPHTHTLYHNTSGHFDYHDVTSRDLRSTAPIGRKHQCCIDTFTVLFFHNSLLCLWRLRCGRLHSEFDSRCFSCLFNPESSLFRRKLSIGKAMNHITLVLLLWLRYVSCYLTVMSVFRKFARSCVIVAAVRLAVKIGSFARVQPP